MLQCFVVPCHLSTHASDNYKKNSTYTYLSLTYIIKHKFGLAACLQFMYAYILYRSKSTKSPKQMSHNTGYTRQK